MIDILNIHGGLGNQMFEYALFCSLKKNHPFRLFLFDIRYANGVHQGYEIDKIFNVNSYWRIKLFSLILRLPKYVYNLFEIFEEKNPFLYDNRVYRQKSFTYYEGCWQSEKYFKNVESQIRSVFSFKQKLLNKKTVRLSNTIKKSGCKYVSIHVRRGDYLTEARYTCTKEYYYKAIEILNNECRDLIFIVFSDDISWTRNNINLPNMTYVDWNVGHESWQDMYLMSICHYNIIANSTFSWWGAWLNDYSNKVVIAPSIWLDEETEKLDIVPDDWILV